MHQMMATQSTYLQFIRKFQCVKLLKAQLFTRTISNNLEVKGYHDKKDNEVVGIHAKLQYFKRASKVIIVCKKRWQQNV